MTKNRRWLKSLKTYSEARKKEIGRREGCRCTVGTTELLLYVVYAEEYNN